MKIVDMTATGDDNVLTAEQKVDLENRKKQLKKLQEEVVDIEEMNTGISIMDLGLNEFRLDLLDYIKENPDLENAPKGMNAIVEASKDLDPGVIFVLRNLEDSVNINSQNTLHPFYMVYLSDEGEILIDHLELKQMLDSFRFLCKGKKEADLYLCSQFNQETQDSKNMGKYSDFLEEDIKSIIEVKNKSELDSFLLGKEMGFLSESFEGMDDFELISFLVIKDKEKHYP